MASSMANIYYKLITANPPRKSIEDVNPASLRAEVQALLDAHAAKAEASADTSNNE